MIRSALAGAVAVMLGACTIPGTASNGPGPIRSSITVFAASSLEPAFVKVAGRVGPLYGLGVVYNYAGTQTLTSQLTQGAQADIFASADGAHMTTLENYGLVAGQPTVFAHNRLEIAVEKGNPKGIRTLADLARPDVVVVLADPSVPAGKYAQQALTRAGVKVKPASLELQVTGVLSKVALGEADAGIVYVSDVTTSGKIDGIAIPDGQNVVADYPVAKLKSAANSPGANEFIKFLLSSEGQSILSAAGFEKA